MTFGNNGVAQGDLQFTYHSQFAVGIAAARQEWYDVDYRTLAILIDGWASRPRVWETDTYSDQGEVKKKKKKTTQCRVPSATRSFPPSQWVQGSGLGEAWRQMEMLQANGKTKSIGVSNYRIMDLEETLKGAEVVPAVNQIEIHPYVYDRARPLIDYCHRKGIHIAAYATLAPITNFPGGPVDPIVDRIALELGITNDQVLLKWAHQVSHEGIVVTSSLKKDRILGQMRALNEVQVLSESQVQEIAQAGLLKHQRVWGADGVDVKHDG
ncbi:hypothetical protein NliqN6_1758 [Naganishia liquefaciens]|uniref:NADP-dependent oxidoreductase domain-containing protein n=1 Tax=Naganishia liquefaciens TaxID=104408 RepID=A0A8H3TQZ8_9TREE|nr:hypothetical protein NliqN6_1758 [Naganishia liquefaciens]